MADTSKGFKFRYRLCGAEPTYQNITFQDTETLTKGDMVNIESGLADLAVTTDANFAGVAVETKAGTTQVSTIKCIVDPDAVYGVYDANARLIGATLDIAGATGAQTVASSSGKEFVVVANSSAAEETLVMINADAHFAKKTQ